MGHDPDEMLSVLARLGDNVLSWAMPSFNELRRSRTQRVIAGVCGGIAQWLDWSPALVRALFIIGSFIPIVPGFVVYAVLWIILKEE